MKTYRGERAPDGTARVSVERDGDRAPLAHLVRYSPDGLDYGSLGPGSIDLARSILADYLGGPPAAPLYRAFVRSFIEPLNRRAPWTISGAEIAAWLAVVEAQDRPDAP